MPPVLKRLGLLLLLPLLSRVPALLQAQDPAQPAAYYNPTWSPDGRTIAFESNREGRFAVYTVDRETGRVRRLTTDEGDASQPAWSPDGRRIVFTLERAGGSQLYRMNADGSHLARLTNGRGKHFYASYSPDGRWIVFGVQDEQRRERYYVGVVRADGSDYRVLTDSTASSEGPRWAADGRRIVFTRTPLLARDSGETMPDLARRRQRASTRISIQRDGSDARVIAAPPPGEGEGEGLALSPDGRFAVLSREVDGRAGLYLIDRATGGERLLVGGRR
jgi:TolB protein